MALFYKCDGIKYNGRIVCESVYGSESKNDKPDHWITIAGVIHNGNEDAHVINCPSTLHFCCKQCLNDYFTVKNIIGSAFFQKNALYVALSLPQQQL